MTIKDRFLEIRSKLELSQADAASKFDIALGSWKKYEKGPSEPGSGALLGLANGGINTNWLLTGKGPMLIADYNATPEPATEITEPMVVLDTKRLQLAIETIEEALTKHRRGLRPAKKAEAIMLAYQIYEEEDKEKDRANFDHASKILDRLIKSMA